jgi:pimeloyl-ACP methyl ester carboxylesterase
MLGLAVGLSAFTLLSWIVLWRRSRFHWIRTPPRASEQRAAGTLRSIVFPAKDGTALEGWLFLPHAPNAPLVIMAPGLGGTKDGFLESFAWGFVSQGVAALAFDYRCFGGSEGEPRHWADPKRHGEDYEAALAFVRGELALTRQVDASRIALWGSSFSGGSAIVLAARDPEIRALVVQCPYLEAPPQLQPRGLSLLRFVVAAMFDSLGIFPAIYVPLFGRPGEWVFAPSRENPSVHEFDGPLGSTFWRLLPKPPLGGWENRMLARMLPSLDGFVPMAQVSRLKCPTLFVAAREDDLVPLELVQRAHSLAGAAIKELRVFEAGHFDLYVGEAHTLNVEAQACFLARHLRATEPSGTK